jgi:hypothetical protein
MSHNKENAIPMGPSHTIWSVHIPKTFNLSHLLGKCDGPLAGLRYVFVGGSISFPWNVKEWEIDQD